MHVEILNYRNAVEILEHRDFRTQWGEVLACVEGITMDDALSTHLGLSRARLEIGKNPPVGLQTSLNELIRQSLEDVYGWEGQPKLFRSDAEGLADWTMDFIKDGIGIEVAFNHESYFPWIFTRLNVAGESTQVVAEHKVKVGITICSRVDAKKWGKMDPSVGVFEKVSLWLEVMRPILPIPMALVGLSAFGWNPPPPVFGRNWWRQPAARSFLEGPSQG